MANKTEVSNYIIARIFQNIAKLVTGTKAQEACLYIVQNTVNQDAYDTAELARDTEINNIELDVAQNQTDIETYASNINANTNAISALDDRVDDLESGAISTVKERNITTFTKKTLVTGDYVFNIFVKVISFNAGATISLFKMVSNPDGVSVIDDYYEAITPALSVSSSFVTIDIPFAVMANYGESGAIDPGIAIEPTNCTVDLIFNKISNFT